MMMATRARGEAVRMAKWMLRPWRRRSRAHALVLLYHRVAQARSDPWKLCVSPENFHDHLEVLGRYCEFISLTELPARLAAGVPPRRTPVAITFDDGYVDNLRHALPVLKAAGAPATVFLATDWLGRAGGFWWDRLAAMVFESPRLPAAINLEVGTATLQWRANRLGATGDGARARLHRALWQFCQSLADHDRDAALKQLGGILSVDCPADPESRPMRPDEVQELHASRLVSIGAHAQSHRPLPMLSESEQAMEIAGSRDACRSLTGVTPECFAYPHGEVAPGLPQLVERAGFKLACSTVQEMAWPGRDRYQLPRVSVSDSDARRFESWLTGTWLR
jgi:peptidoglycan/xylan/chitin deacetylase (PgdA/CDA1 family)